MTQRHTADFLSPPRKNDWRVLDLSFLPDGFVRSGRLLARIGIALCMIIIAVGSLAPPSLADLSATGIGDKTAHLVGYAGTMLCAAFSVVRGRACLGWGLFLIGYGALMEWGQAYMAQGREASWADMAANGAGIIVGVASAVLLVQLGRWCLTLKATDVA